MQSPRLQPLAQEHRVLYESADPERVFAYSPGLVRLPSGRLLATMDQGGAGVADLSGPKGWRGEGRHAWQGRIYTSDDHGVTWQERGLFPFMHSRPFVGGNRIADRLEPGGDGSLGNRFAKLRNHHVDCVARSAGGGRGGFGLGGRSRAGCEVIAAC